MSSRMERWYSKIALVTGASSGIGKAVATKLVEHGMKVVGCSPEIERLEEIASKANKNGPGEMFPYQCDFNHESQILEMFGFIKKKFGTIHVCVNNAGLGHNATILSGKTEDWRDMINVNVLGVCIVTREAVSLMRSSGVDDGHVINMNSFAGHQVVGSANFHFYSATKFAITAINEGLRRELREEKSNIRVTSISPGAVETQFYHRMSPGNPEFANNLFSSIRCLQPDDIANTIIFALSAPLHMEINEVLVRSTDQEL